MSDNILVGVRLRPLISREVSDGPAIHWQVGAENTITQIDPASRRSLCAPYKFDRVFGMDYNNEDIYYEIAEGIIESALAGFNGTIFAYGQTSSGKTYTMMGDKQNPGVIPLAIQNIFQSIENNPDREYLIRVSYMEIYNENITDLLSGREQKGKGLTVREDTSGAVYVIDLKEECVNSEEMLLSLMKKGNKNRHVGTTNMNERSSRSHTIFRLILESRERSDASSNTDEAVTVSHLNLVDLAGSENASQTGATGERLKEGGFINKSLFMLGRVISQLSEGEQFVNFRDSKLTRILQTSLGGNAKTAIICTVTPVGVEQTHSTLRFASRAKAIKNKPVVNEVLSDTALLKRYAREIKNLQESLARERNTDKAQEVEQVREMLDEKERKNQELLARVNELKTKLVVSSLPRESSRGGASKKKLRRETWAAPAALRAMRMSMAPVRIEPIKLDQDFLHPMLPAWVNQSKIAEESELDCTNGNVSTLSDGFGKEYDIGMDLAEQSKLGKLDYSFDRASSVIPKPWKRVHFRLSNHEDVSDAECQTDDSLLPRLQLTQCRQIPGTPVHVLRARNLDLMEKINMKEELLKESQKEMVELTDFQKNEILFLEESFRLKILDGPVDSTKLEEMQKEINDLKRSLSDSEVLLLDANRNVSKKSEEVNNLQAQVKQLTEKSLGNEKFGKEFSALQEKYEALQKTMGEKVERLNQLENERKDFDMMMELAIEKQRVKEKDLRRSLDEAWKEIAAHENSNSDEVKSRHERMSELEAEVLQLRASTSTNKEMQICVESLKEQLDEALSKKGEAEQERNEMKIKFCDVSVLDDRLKEMETLVSQMEIMKAELLRAEDNAKSLAKENADLKEVTDTLKLQVNQMEAPEALSRIQELELENQLLREKLDEVDNGEPVFTVSPASQTDTPTAFEISRKLSETLQVLEESLMVPMPSTPRKFSASFSEPFIQPHDLATIKEQLLALQEALLAQELQFQKQKSQQESVSDAVQELLMDQRICCEIAAEVEAEARTWQATESFVIDYISYGGSVHLSQPTIPNSGEIRKADLLLMRKSVGFPNIELLLQEAVKEARKNIHTEYSEKSNMEQAALESRLKEDTFIEGDTLYIPSQSDEGYTPKSLELTMGNGLEISMLNNLSVFHGENSKSVNDLQKLREENSALLSQIEYLHAKLKEHEHCSSCKEGSKDDHMVVWNPSMDSLGDSMPLAGKSLGEIPSLADELREAGFNVTLCEDSFETSVFVEAPSDVQESESQKQKTLLITGDPISQLETDTENNKNAETDGAAVDTAVGDHETLNMMERDLKRVLSEKSRLESEIEHLKEELSNARILIEEMHCLRWQVETLKEEKSGLEEELKAAESVENQTLNSERYDFAAQKDTNLVTDHDKCNDEIKKLLAQLNKIQEENKVLAEQKIAVMEETISHDRQTIDSKKKKTGDEVVIETENSQIEESFTKLQEELQAKQKELQAANEELKSMRQNLSLREKELHETEVTCEKLRQTLSSKIKEQEEAKQQSDSSQEKVLLEDKTCQNVSMACQDIEETQKKLCVAQEKIESLLQELKDQHKYHKDKIACIIEEKDSEMEALITNFTEKEETYEKKISLFEKLQMTTPDFSVADFEVKENLNKRCTNLQSTIDNLHIMLSKKEHEFSVLEESYKKLQNELSNVVDKYNTLMDELKEKLKSFEEKHATITNELESTKKQVDEQNTLQQEADQEKTNLKEEFDKLVLELEEQKSLVRLKDKEKEALVMSYENKLMARKPNDSIDDYEENEVILKKLQEFEELSTSYSRKVAECRELRDSLTNLEMLKVKTEEKLTTLKEEHQQELAVYTTFLEKRDEQIRCLEEEVKDKTQEIASFMSGLETKEYEVKRLQKDMEEIQQAYEKQKFEHEELLLNNEKNMALKVSELEYEIERLTNLYDEVCNDRTEMAEAIHEKEEAAKELLIRSETLESHIQNLQDERDLLQEKCSLKQKEIDQKNEEVSTLKEQHMKWKDEIDNLKIVEQQMNEQHESDNQQIGKLIEIIEKLETDLAQKDRKLVHALEWEAELKSKEEMLQQLRKETEALTSHLCDAKSENENLKKAQSKLEKELENIKRKSDDEKTINEKLAIAEERLQLLQSDFDIKLSKFKHEISVHISEKKDLTEKLTGVEAELEKAYSDVKNGQDRHRDLLDEVRAKNAAFEVLSKERDGVTAKLSDLNEELTSMKEVMKKAETEVLQQSFKISVLQSEKQALKASLEEQKLQEKQYEEQSELNNQQLDKLVGIIEKFEAERLEKDEQYIVLENRYKNEITERDEHLKRLTLEIEKKSSKILETETIINQLQSEHKEVLKKLQSLEYLEEKRVGNTRHLSEKENILSNKAKGEFVQSDLEEKIKFYESEVLGLLSEKKELVSELASVKEKLKTVEQELQKSILELQAKKEECAKLDAEMDDMVKHYRRENEEKRVRISDLTENCKKIESQLSETKDKLRLSQIVFDSSANDSASTKQVHQEVSFLQDTIQSLKSELEAKQNELHCKEHECAKLNKEKDEMVEHFKKESHIHHKELVEITGKVQEADTLKNETAVSGKEFEALQSEYLKLKSRFTKLKEKCMKLEECKASLAEEVKVGSATMDNLLERLGDLEKSKDIWAEEKEALMKQIKEYENEADVLTSSIADQNAGKQIRDLLHKVNALETDLKASTKAFESIAEECNEWKQGYTKQFEECEKLKEKLVNGKLTEKQKSNYEEKIYDLTTRLNTLMNKSCTDSSSLDMSKGSRKSKIRDLEKSRDELFVQVSELFEKNSVLEKHLENLRQSHGVVSTVEQFQIELDAVNKKKKEVERERDILNENYDVLEKELENLRSGDGQAMEEMKKETARLQEELALLKQTSSLKTSDVGESEDAETVSVKERVIVLERENNELRFRLRALNAPAEKEVQALKAELSNANSKVAHLKAELRRIQNSNNVDSTICEMKGQPMRTRLFTSEESEGSDKYDYSSKSGVVMEVQLLVLQNKLHQLEKENKSLTQEHKSMEQHVEHYKNKAQEWKDSCVKERKTREKVKKEADTWRAENARLQKDVADSHSVIERQQFELGSQREMIDKLGKDVGSSFQQRPRLGSVPVSAASAQKNVKADPVKEDSSASCKSGEDKIQVGVDNTPTPVPSYLKVHNAPYPSQTRTERLPFSNTFSDEHKTPMDKQPLWKRSYKENKDYSKYYLPQDSSQKKKDEECKTQ